MNDYLPYRFVPTQPPLAKITIRQIRFDITQNESDAAATVHCCKKVEKRSTEAPSGLMQPFAKTAADEHSDAADRF